MIFLEWREKFSRNHPLNSKIRDRDIFLHVTSQKKYSAIEASGSLRRNAPKRTYSISQSGVICFEKYVKKGISELSIKGYCNDTCRSDNSKEAVILEIKGEKLKKLGVNIYADWIDGYPLIHDSEGRSIDVNTEGSFLSIIIVDCDVPLEYLEVVRKVPVKEHNIS